MHYLALLQTLMNSRIRTSSSPIRITRWAEIGYISAAIWWCIDSSITWSSHRSNANTSTWSIWLQIQKSNLEFNFSNAQCTLHTYPSIHDMVLYSDYCYYFALLYRSSYFVFPNRTPTMCFRPAIFNKEEEEGEEKEMNQININKNENV